MPVYEGYRNVPEIGPVVKMGGLCRAHGAAGIVLAKLEFGGPTSNMSDRVCAGMFQLAAARGELVPGCTITEAAGGPFAFSFAVQASLFGYKPVLCMPATASGEERIRLQGAGARIVTTPIEQGWPGAMARALEIADDERGYFLNYTENDDNPEVHRRTTGPEIYNATDGMLDILVAGVGSAGTITGTAEYLKGWAGNIRAVAVQPLESQVLTGGFAGRHGIAGLGLPFVPANYNPFIVDDIVNIATGDAAATAEEAFTLDGVPANVAGGAALAAALALAKKPENASKRIVAVVCGKRPF